MKLSEFVENKGFVFEQCRFFSSHRFNENWFQMLREKFLGGNVSKSDILDCYKVSKILDIKEVGDHFVEIPPIFFPMIKDEDEDTMCLRIVFPDARIQEDELEKLNMKVHNIQPIDFGPVAWQLRSFLTKEERNQIGFFLTHLTEVDLFHLGGTTDEYFPKEPILEIIFNLEKDEIQNEEQLDNALKFLIETDTVVFSKDLKEFKKERENLQTKKKLLSHLKNLLTLREQIYARCQEVRKIYLQLLPGSFEEPDVRIDFKKFQEIVTRTNCFGQFSRPRNRHLTDLEVCQLKKYCKKDPERMKILNAYPHLLVPVENELTEEEAENLIHRSMIFVAEKDLPPLPEKPKPTKFRTFEEIFKEGDIPLATRSHVLEIIVCSRNYSIIQEMDMPDCGRRPYQLGMVKTLRMMEKFLPIFREQLVWMQAEGIWTDEMEAFFSE